MCNRGAHYLKAVAAYGAFTEAESSKQYIREHQFKRILRKLLKPSMNVRSVCVENVQHIRWKVATIPKPIIIQFTDAYMCDSAYNLAKADRKINLWRVFYWTVKKMTIVHF